MRLRIVVISVMIALATLSFGFCLAEDQAYSVGSKSEMVRQIQQRLIDLDLLDGKADGIFGKKTEQAVMAFQSTNQLKPTGIVDSRTLAFLLPPEAVISTLEQFYLDLDMNGTMNSAQLLAKENGLFSKIIDTDGVQCLQVAPTQDDLVLSNGAALVRIYYTDSVCGALEYYNPTTHLTVFEYHSGEYWLLNGETEPGLYLTTHSDKFIPLPCPSRDAQIALIHQDPLYAISLRTE